MSECDLVTHREGHCSACGTMLKGKQKRWCSRKCYRTYMANHRWTNAKRAAKEAVTFYQCAECNEFFQKVEVDHIVPCRQLHGVFGCHHHQSNLRVLCVGCHRKKTNQDRERGWT